MNLDDEPGHFARRKLEYEARLAKLRAMIDEGDASGVAEGNGFERVREKLKLPPRPL
jgi:hypothetical protein